MCSNCIWLCKTEIVLSFLYACFKHLVREVDVFCHGQYNLGLIFCFCFFYSTCLLCQTRNISYVTFLLILGPILWSYSGFGNSAFYSNNETVNVHVFIRFRDENTFCPNDKTSNNLCFHPFPFNWITLFGIHSIMNDMLHMPCLWGQQLNEYSNVAVMWMLEI